MDKQLTIRVPGELYLRVESAARRLRRSRSDVVRFALEAWLAGDAGGESERTPWSRVSDLLGTFESGVPDLGSSHRRRS